MSPPPCPPPEGTLHRARQFARLYDAPPEPGLTWSHYRELLTVGDDEARAFYAERVREKGWGRRELRNAIEQRVFDAGDDAALSPVKLKRPDDASYLYACEVDDVVDGDTLVARVDLGFSVIKRQRVRLANVDAPPAKAAAGKRAARWLQERMARPGAVVVRTHKADLHGRYVGDVFYGGAEDASAEQVFRRGKWLNGELVAKGLARAVRG